MEENTKTKKQVKFKEYKKKLKKRSKIRSKYKKIREEMKIKMQGLSKHQLRHSINHIERYKEKNHIDYIVENRTDVIVRFNKYLGINSSYADVAAGIIKDTLEFYFFYSGYGEDSLHSSDERRERAKNRILKIFESVIKKSDLAIEKEKKNEQLRTMDIFNNSCG